MFALWAALLPTVPATFLSFIDYAVLVLVSNYLLYAAPNGVGNGGLPRSMWGSHLSSGPCEQHTTRTTIVLAFWQIYDNAILIMFGAI
jgi:hypothetical protein